MAIDWASIFGAAVSAAGKAVQNDAPQVEDYLREIATGHERALTEIGEAFAAGDIDEDTFKSELNDEAKTLEAELHAVAVITKAIAEHAANVFRDTLFAGIKGAINALI